MIYILLSIFCSVAIVFIFKFIEKFKINLLSVIILNYTSAFILGNLLSSKPFNLAEIIICEWFIPSFIISFLLIGTFYLIGFSIQKIGVSKTTISNKMSVVLPILFSILYYNEKLDFVKLIGIVLALFSIFLATFKNGKQKTVGNYFFLPILLFIGVGLIDSFLKYSQQEYLTNKNLPLFTAVSFGIAGIIGLVISLFIKPSIYKIQNIKSIPVGIILGILNFGTMYFLILALEYSNFESSVVYGVNNIGIITFSVLGAFLFFKEKITKLNIVGIILAIISISILTRLFY